MDFIRKRSALRRGQRVLQVAFGSGFKCNSAVWLCLNNPPVKQVDEEKVKQLATVKLVPDGSCVPTTGAKDNKHNGKEQNGTTTAAAAAPSETKKEQ